MSDNRSWPAMPPLRIGPAHKLMLESKENQGHRQKISSIDCIKSSHSIPHQILPNFDVKEPYSSKTNKTAPFNKKKSQNRMKNIIMTLDNFVSMTKPKQNYIFTHQCNIMHKICISM